MEAHDQILHGLLDMGQMLLLCGAEPEPLLRWLTTEAQRHKKVKTLLLEEP